MLEESKAEIVTEKPNFLNEENSSENLSTLPELPKEMILPEAPKEVNIGSDLIALEDWVSNMEDILGLNTFKTEEGKVKYKEYLIKEFNKMAHFLETVPKIWEAAEKCNFYTYL